MQNSLQISLPLGLHDVKVRDSGMMLRTRSLFCSTRTRRSRKLSVQVSASSKLLLEHKSFGALGMYILISALVEYWGYWCRHAF